MTTRAWLFAMAGALSAIGGLGYFFFSGLIDGGGVSVAEGEPLYAKNCARCHGANLEGQPDWMKRGANGRLPAPPHDDSGHTWHHSDKQLFTIVKFGLQALAPGYESDMPAYENLLTDGEIDEILAYIKSTWPERASAYQEARNRADP